MMYRNILIDTAMPFGAPFEAESIAQAEEVSRHMMNAAQQDSQEILFYYTQRLDGDQWVTAIA